MLTFVWFAVKYSKDTDGLMMMFLTWSLIDLDLVSKWLTNERGFKIIPVGQLRITVRPMKQIFQSHSQLVKYWHLGIVGRVGH